MKHNNFIYSALPNQAFSANTLLISDENNADFILQDFNGQCIYYKITACKVTQLDFNIDDLDINHQASTLKEKHIDNVTKAIDAIKHKKLKKVIIAKQSFVAHKVNIERLLEDLKSNFPNAFVYALRLNKHLWIGATPEVLISGTNSNGYTVHSLAGTKKITEDFSQKEIKEQALVSHYIKNILHKAVENLVEQATEEKQYGNIKHLLNSYNFSTQKPLAIAKKLHPTPAIVGIPNKEAKKFIDATENFERKLYCGFLGFNNAQQSQLFVNLRCGQVFNNGIMLYAGGGITENSVAEEEWQESENKVATFTELIKKNSIASI